MERRRQRRDELLGRTASISLELYRRLLNRKTANTRDYLLSLLKTKRKAQIVKALELNKGLDLLTLDEISEFFDGRSKTEWAQGGLNWIILELYPESVDYIDRVSITGFNLPQLPASLKNLKNLKTLRVLHCGLKSLPSWLSSMRKLNEIDVSYNDLKEFPPVIKSMKSLQYLYLNSNNIRVVPEWVGKLKNLKALGLSGTGITSLPESVIDLGLDHLLTLRNNRLPDYIVEEILEFNPNAQV